MKVAVEKRERERNGVAALLTQDRSGFWTFFYKRTCLALNPTLLGLLGLVGDSDPYSQANDPSRDDDEGSWRDVGDRHGSRIRRWCDGEDHWRKRCTNFFFTLSNCFKRGSSGDRVKLNSQTPLGARVQRATKLWVNGREPY